MEMFEGRPRKSDESITVETKEEIREVAPQDRRNNEPHLSPQYRTLTARPTRGL
jgi:hypothetical protein